jgi:hypothetical protein
MLSNSNLVYVYITVKPIITPIVLAPTNADIPSSKHYNTFTRIDVDITLSTDPSAAILATIPMSTYQLHPPPPPPKLYCNPITQTNVVLN